MVHLALIISSLGQETYVAWKFCKNLVTNFKSIRGRLSGTYIMKVEGGAPLSRIVMDDH